MWRHSEEVSHGLIREITMRFLMLRTLLLLSRRDRDYTFHVLKRSRIREDSSTETSF